MFSTINQTLSFHQSPETFISSKLHELASNQPDAFPPTTGGGQIIRASILNRQVYVISSYQLCKEILTLSDDQEPKFVRSSGSNVTYSEIFSVGPAYKELMQDWFPAPNLLLEDFQHHVQHKEAWIEQMVSLPEDLELRLREITKKFITENFQPGLRIDLYETLKTLAWELLLGAFLDLDAEIDKDRFTKVEQLQESLLRGQFSLFPVAINAVLWQSARSRGLKARRDLQMLLSKHVHTQNLAKCPLFRKPGIDKIDIANHCLLFTSSIANKALASLLTASIMNIYLMPGENNLASLLQTQPEDDREKLLKSILLETERLSPPVIGVMRRVEDHITLKSETDSTGHVVPKGHDIWLYFVGANRDGSTFENAQQFQFDRYMTDAPEGLAFGAGRKKCLGSDVARKMAFILADEMLKADIDLEGEAQSEGVQAWLGWKLATFAEAFSKDLKQLPCQRPRLPVWVTVRQLS